MTQPNRVQSGFRVSVYTLFVLCSFFLLTETSRILAVLSYSGIAMINMTIGSCLVLGALYLRNGRSFLSFFKSFLNQWLAVLLLLVPILSSLYSSKLFLRELLLAVFYFLVFVSCYVFSSSVSRERLNRMVFISLLANVVLGVLSMILPGWFDLIALLSDDTSNQGGRAFGLFMQPNIYGTVLVFHYLALRSLSDGQKSSWSIIIFFLTMVGVLLSGSRLNIAFFLLVAGSERF